MESNALKQSLNKIKLTVFNPYIMLRVNLTHFSFVWIKAMDILTFFARNSVTFPILVSYTDM